MSNKSKPLKYINASLGDPLFRFLAPLNYTLSQVGDESRSYHFGTTFGISGTDPYTETCLNLQDHFRKRMQKKKEEPISEGIRDFMPVDGGTSRAFNLLMRYLVQDVRNWNNEITFQNRRTGQKIPLTKPVIIMPIPTYGHFLEMADKLDGIEVVRLMRDHTMNWAVNPDHLDKMIKELRLQGKRVVAYYDSNPNNPTGYVRGKDETESIAKVIKAHSDLYDTIDRATYSNAYKKRKRHRMMPITHTNRIRVIDDTVYTGLEYTGQNQPYSFRQIPELRDDCFVITGPSKMGLAGIRAGLIIGNDRDLGYLREMEKLEGYCPSVITMRLLSNIYNDKAQSKRWWADYKRKATTYYQYAGLLTKALINGIGTMADKVDAPLIERMIKDICKVKNCTDTEAKDILEKGIDGVRVITSPQSGFFHLVDFSTLKGYLYDEAPYHVGENARELKCEFSISRLQAKFNFAMASGGYMGLPADRCIRRITFAMKPVDIIDMVDRIKGIRESLRPSANIINLANTESDEVTLKVA